MLETSVTSCWRTCPKRHDLITTPMSGARGEGPGKRIVPDRGERNPAIHSNNVLLPLPPGPRKATSAKVGFHGVTPTAQAAHKPDPSAGTTVDAEAPAAINAMLAALEAKGLLAGS